jgi:hypothetical protein
MSSTDYLDLATQFRRARDCALTGEYETAKVCYDICLTLIERLCINPIPPVTTEELLQVGFMKVIQ